MNTFLVIAAVMAAIAAAAVALPLLRDRQSRRLGALLAVMVIGASAGLYPLWSNWNWHAPAQSEAAAGPDVAAMGLGEAMSLRAGGDITPQAAQLFEDALALAPGNPKALLYAGFAAAVRGDRALARTRWQALKALNPPPQIVQMLDARIAELGPPSGIPAAGGAADTSSPGSGAPPAG